MMQLRKDAGRKICEIFMDDRSFDYDACFRHAIVQSEAVFSYAMTIIDEIYVLKDEEKRMGSKFAACMWICTKEVLIRGQIPNPEMEEYQKERMMSIMLCTNWICADTFENHEWVSESIVTQHVEEVMDMELDYEICVPCVI